MEATAWEWRIGNGSHGMERRVSAREWRMRAPEWKACNRISFPQLEDIICIQRAAVSCCLIIESTLHPISQFHKSDKLPASGRHYLYIKSCCLLLFDHHRIHSTPSFTVSQKPLPNLGQTLTGTLWRRGQKSGSIYRNLIQCGGDQCA